jgi:hypothetical protein
VLDRAVAAVELDARDAEVRRGVDRDDARRDRLGRRLVAQAEEALVASALVGEAAQVGELGAQPRVLLREIVVLGARVRELDEPPRDARDAARDVRHRRLRG